MAYKLRDSGVIRLSDGAAIPDNPTNRDWRKYQDWLAEDNTPDPADPPPAPAKFLTTEIIEAVDQVAKAVPLTAAKRNKITALMTRVSGA